MATCNNRYERPGPLRAFHIDIVRPDMTVRVDLDEFDLTKDHDSRMFLAAIIEEVQKATQTKSDIPKGLRPLYEALCAGCVCAGCVESRNEAEAEDAA